MSGFNIKVEDFPKLDSPFKREWINNKFLVTPTINPGYEWVFTDKSVMAIEKLHGTNVSIVVQEGTVIAIFNRTGRVPFINGGKAHIVAGVQEAYTRGYIDRLGNGQHFGELVGEKINGNPHKIKGHLWIPFNTYAQKHLKYNSWGKYPKTFDAINMWFEHGLFSLIAEGDMTAKSAAFTEGIVFTHPDGRMAKLRRDMFPWYSGPQHKEVEE